MSQPRNALITKAHQFTPSVRFVLVLLVVYLLIYFAQPQERVCLEDNVRIWARGDRF